LPATEKAKELDGAYAGFQPKPAVEVIIVAMKPLKEGTFTEQAKANGKGITWLDDCRIPNQDNENADRLPGNLLVSDQALGRASKFFNFDLWEDVRLPFILSPKASTDLRQLPLFFSESARPTY
jgi:site-specific DNA-methyltransferase (adenine-specific)